MGSKGEPADDIHERQDVAELVVKFILSFQVVHKVVLFAMVGTSLYNFLDFLIHMRYTPWLPRCGRCSRQSKLHQTRPSPATRQSPSHSAKESPPYEDCVAFACVEPSKAIVKNHVLITGTI